MTTRLEIYKCEVCGNMVEMVHAGAGQLVCCGQERSHFAVLVDTRQYLENPAAWFSEKERTGYDGA